MFRAGIERPTMLFRPILQLAVAAFLCAPAAAVEKIKIGLVAAVSDAPFLIAEARGYYKDAGVEVEAIHFDSAARQMAPLATGDLDVGSGAISAGLFNAASRKIDLKIVADRSRMAPGYRFMTLMMRKKLIDAGKFKSYADLKGMKIALAAPGIGPATMLNAAAVKGGLKFADVEKIYIGYPQQVGAFHNDAVDGSIMIEPFATAIANAGEGVRFSTTEDFFPGAQIALVYYGEKFASGKSAAAGAFMKAYIRATRDYNDAIVNGKFGDDANARGIVAMLVKSLGMSEANIRGGFMHAVDPDARPNVESIKRDIEFFRANGDLAAEVALDKIVDASFIDAAVKELGPYKPSRKP